MTSSRILGLLAIPVLFLTLLYAAETRPGYFTNFNYLGGLLLLEVLAVTLWNYEKWFFAVLMMSFLWAGSNLPLWSAGNVVRWFFLGFGALVGLVKWGKVDRRHHFSALHLVALLCVLAAAVSSSVSTRSEMSLLKSLSLFLLFLYGSCGARVALAGRESAFFRGLLTACEVVSYLSGFLYLVLRFEVFGNPNSLGAVMGVVIIPILLWGVLITEDRNVRQRRTIALCLATFLLFFSLCRAGILASAVAATILCVVLRRQQLFLKGAFLLVFLVTVVAVVQPAQFDKLIAAFTEDVIYKGKPETGVFGSRRSPWTETADVIRESPWFGSGFGTDMVTAPTAWDSNFRTIEEANHEHGNSYLALVQYVGLAGVIPFAILLLLVLGLIVRTCSWIRRSADPRNYALPLVLVCIAGLVHAVFEDWLFAVGYYLTVFFWTFVFLLYDLQPQPVEQSIVYVSKGSLAARPVPMSANQLTPDQLTGNQ
ncbi:MAG: O-antigen ligase family protein [Candidatus Sulfotelmatobacter sp.]